MYLLDHRQHPRLVVVIPVRTNTQVDLLRERVLFVRCRQLEDAVFTWKPRPGPNYPATALSKEAMQHEDSVHGRCPTDDRPTIRAKSGRQHRVITRT